MKSTIISKIRKFATQQPTLVAFCLGLAITFAIGVVIGLLDYHQAYAFMDPKGYFYCTHHPNICDA